MPKCGRRSDLPPYESHVGALLSQDMVNRNAPFGTKFTPTLRTKIIGGKSYTIQERPAPIPTGPILKVQTQRSMHDDAVQTDFADNNASIAVEIPHTHNQNTKSGQTSAKYWNNHNIVPPIEPDTAHYQQPSTSNKFQPQIQQTTEQHKSTNINTTTTNETKPASDNEKPYVPRDYSTAEVSPHSQAWKPVAGYSYLPTQPINLSADQEIFLINKLSEEIGSCDLEQIRGLYQDLAANDHQLTGWINYSDFALSLQKHGIYPNLNTLRLLASTCVSSTELGVINYEKLLTLLITAVKKGKAKLVPPPSYFADPEPANSSQAAPDDRPPSAGSAVTEGQLLRLIQQQILQSPPDALSIEKLRREFSRADRSYRLTLSHSEIKNICKKMKAPIHPSVINEMLAHCQSHGDGQYVWSDFIHILERVLPHATGLPIPESKRPSEYARTYPQPNESWPHPDPNNRNKKQETTPDAKPLQRTLHTSGVNRQKVLPPIISPRSLQHQNVSAPAVLEHRMKNASPPPIKPDANSRPPLSQAEKDDWFLGVKKLAGALYRNDLDRKGSMKPEQCRWLITEYNDIYDLHLQPEVIDSCIQRSTTRAGTDIDELLRSILVSRY